MRDYGGIFSGVPVLITGGAGFIGSHLARTLAALGARVRVLDDLSGGYRENLPAEAELFVASVLDDAALRGAMRGCAYVFHQAAMVSVPQSVAEPEKCMMINVVGTERVLAAAKDLGVRRVMFAASAAAYGNNPQLPSRETHVPDSWSPYAASKIAGELLLQTFSRCYGLSTCSLRYFNIFGPRQDPKSPYAAVISAFADALIAGRMPRILGDGQQTRDFVPVANVVHANLLAASSEKALQGEVLNIGTGGRISLLQLAEEMGRALGIDVKPTFGEPRAGDVRHSCPDVSRAKEVLGYEPIMGFAEGIRLTLEWAASVKK